MNDLRFSERYAIQLLFENYINKQGNSGTNCVFNFLVYASEHGWLNIGKIKKDFRPPRVNKVMIYNENKLG